MRFVKITVILILIGLIPISCFCPPPQKGPYKLNFSRLTVYKRDYLKLFQSGNATAHLSENEVFNGDTLKMALDYIFNFATNNGPSFNFTPNAYAFQCDDDPIYTGLKDKVKSISITSDTTYNEIKSGDILNNNLLISTTTKGKFIPITTYLERFNTIDGDILFREGPQLFCIIEKPKTRQRHKFKITFTFESGRTQTAETPRIIWQ